MTCTDDGNNDDFNDNDSLGFDPEYEMGLSINDVI